MISSAEFRKYFLERMYFSDVSAFQGSQQAQMKADFVQTLQDLTDQPFRVHFKRNRKILAIDLDLACESMWMIKLVARVKSIADTILLSDEFIKHFGNFDIAIMGQPLNSGFSVDRIVTNLKSRKFKVDGKSYQVELDAVTTATIIRFVELAQQAKIISVIINEDYQHKTNLEFQRRFEEETKLSLDEIESVFFNYTPEVFHTYLTKHGFTGEMDVDSFPKNTCNTDQTLYKCAYPLNGWECSRKPDGYGHECGAAIEVSYKNRTLSRYGWSSDD